MQKKNLLIYCSLILFIGLIGSLTISFAAHAASDNNHGSLQLKTFYPPTPTPTHTPVLQEQPPQESTPISMPPIAVSTPPPASSCVKDSSGNCCTMEGPPPCCSGINLVIIHGGGGSWGSTNGPSSGFTPDQAWCDSKPVIYLYPTEPTYVSVKLQLPGEITESIPTYPINGWSNIYAYPDGHFVYDGKDYTELYYESVVKHVVSEPANGIVVSKSEYKKTLRYFADKFQLTSNEKNEFVNYWIHRLDKINSPYMFFSFFPAQDKEKIDGVEISPKPDTMIAFIMYFKPLREDTPVSPLIFPTIPQRNGFTAVEWGGILENN